MRSSVLFIAPLAAPFWALAQTPAPAAAAKPAFDVASIRPSQASREGGRGGEPGGRGNPFRRDNIKITPDSVILRNMSLKSTIAWAYGVKDFQVTGPDWLDNDRSDIVAKAAGESTEDQLRVMMETLLADRFKVTLHRSTKETQAYVLVIGKGGSKLVPTQSEGDSDVQPDQSKMQVTILRTPLSTLTDLLYMVLRTPVVDETGLKGKYDLTINVMKYASMAGDGNVDPVGIIMTALQEEMGLKLESRKVALDMVVVDHAEKTAGDN
jgi:uncharacterized protein (TIGR03435 family)